MEDAARRRFIDVQRSCEVGERTLTWVIVVATFDGFGNEVALSVREQRRRIERLGERDDLVCDTSGVQFGLVLRQSVV